MECQLRNLLVADPVGCNLAALPEEHEAVRAVPVLDHVQTFVDLATVRYRTVSLVDTAPVKCSGGVSRLEGSRPASAITRFGATGITAKIENPEARVEVAQYLAGHADPKTTKLYDRRDARVSLDEIERIGI